MKYKKNVNFVIFLDICSLNLLLSLKMSMLARRNRMPRFFIRAIILQLLEKDLLTLFFMDNEKVTERLLTLIFRSPGFR